MNTRQQLILRQLIELYIDDAQPVGSHTLVEKGGLDVSAATVRNDMALLEREGFITHLHTSAGRIPTARGYRLYVSGGIRPRAEPKIRAALEQAVCMSDDEELVLKTLAKTLASLSEETILVAFDPTSSYYTGVSHLLRKPDFADVTDLYSIGDLVDQFDEVIPTVYQELSDEVVVRVGEEHPFGPEMSVMLVRYTFHHRIRGMLGLLGPMRMDYERNLGLIQQAANALANASYE